jgi:hypothetical protein
MKKSISLLAVTAVLAIAVGVPAYSALSEHDGRSGVRAENHHGAAQARLARGDGDSDHRAGARHHDDEDECDDDEGACGGGRNPAPAGSVAPPKNGLFGTGAAPAVQVN